MDAIKRRVVSLCRAMHSVAGEKLRDHQQMEGLQPLLAFGVWTHHADAFPRTVRCVESKPKLRTALVSRLEAGTRLNPHRGHDFLANEVLRCHVVLHSDVERTSFVEVTGKRT